MRKTYDESKHVRNDKGQYANKIKQAKPGELPDEPTQTEFDRKVDARLHGMSLADFKVRRPVLVVTQPSGSCYVARAVADWNRRTVSVPVNIGGASYSLDVLAYDPTGRQADVYPHVTSVRQGSEQDLQADRDSHRLLEYDTGELYQTKTTGDGNTVRVGANFKRGEGPKGRAQRMERTFHALQDAGYIPAEVHATFRTRDRAKPGVGRWPATDVTYSAPKGVFWRVPHVAEIRDRAGAGDERAQLLLATLEGEGVADDDEGYDLYLAQRAQESNSAYMLETPVLQRLTYVNSEMDTSFMMLDETSTKQGGVAARYEERLG